MTVHTDNWKALRMSTSNVYVQGEVFTEDTPLPGGAIGCSETLLDLSLSHHQSEDRSILQLRLTLSPTVNHQKTDLHRGKKLVHRSVEGTYETVQIFCEATCIATITVEDMPS